MTRVSIENYAPALRPAGFEVDRDLVALDDRDNYWIAAGVHAPMALAADIVGRELYAGTFTTRVEDPAEQTLIKIILSVPQNCDIEWNALFADGYGPLFRHSVDGYREKANSPYFMSLKRRGMSKALQEQLRDLVEEAASRARQARHPSCRYVRFDYPAHCYHLSNHTQLALKGVGRALPAQQTATT